MNSKLKMQNAKLLVLAIAATLVSVLSIVAQSDGSQQNKTGRGGTFAIVGAGS
ncbi:MAG: hypothetical protein IPG58_02530 [Acidobacteria bacterium]|nr:hypothetical protein [Acidobacteriota bacterium]